jgi:hypothetical protein
VLTDSDIDDVICNEVMDGVGSRLDASLRLGVAIEPPQNQLYLSYSSAVSIRD